MSVFELYQLTPPVSDDALRVYQLYFNARELMQIDPHAALELCERGLALSRMIEYAPGEAWYGREAGDIQFGLGNVDAARTHLERGIALFEQLGIAVGVASASNILGSLEFGCANHARAITLYSTYTRISKTLHRKQSEAYGLGNLARVYLELGNPWQALELHRSSLTLLESIEGDQSGLAWALSTLGSVYHALGQTDAALENLQRALYLQREINDQHYAAYTLCSLGACHLARHDYAAALGALEEALVMAERTDDRLIQSGVLTLQALTHLERGAAVPALQSATEAFAHAERSRDRSEQLRSRVVIARARLIIGANSESVDADLRDLELMLEQVLATDAGALQVFALTHLILALRQRGQLEAALERSDQLRDLERQLAKTDTERLVIVMNSQLDAERDRFDLDLARARAETLVAVNADLQRLNHENTELLRQVSDQARVLERLSNEDPLTGVYNRRHMDAELQRLWVEAQQLGRPMCVAMIDIDRFKRVNDHHSHAVGDRVLRVVSAIFKSKLRPADTICRYGGEEFVVLLPDVSLGDAVATLERLRIAVLSHDWAALGVTEGVTVSAGVAINRDAADAAKLVALADEAQYQAKRAGRNRVKWHGEL